jgi:serine/threonine-protein kinase
MPVVDYSLLQDWLVMPLAQGNAEDARSSLSDDRELHALIMAVCSALESAHEEGWLHRDLKPANLLLLDGRWMVADWGLGRRPRGETTSTGRTTPGEFYGTQGFAAPEQGIDAHEVTASADFYSLGRIIGWARADPKLKNGLSILPQEEPWRSIVAAATQEDPAARPQNVRGFRELVRTGGLRS